MSPASHAQEFWQALDQLVAGAEISIDRPRGSAHPRYLDRIYPLDYGYLAGTTTVDGGGLDVWIGSLPERRLSGLLLTVDLLKRDAEMKLMLGCTPDEVKLAFDFLNGYGMHVHWLSRDGQTREALRELLQNRRSVRRFLPEPVAPEVLQSVLEAARWAPSAHNRQPWRLVVLQTQPARHRFASLLGREFRRDLLADGLPLEAVEAQVKRSYRRIVDAPACILLCLDPLAGDNYPDPTRQAHELMMAAQGTAMAGYALLLAAQAAGLGGVWVCAPLFAQMAARQALDLPESWQAQGLILLGYPATIPDPRPRRPLAEVMVYR